MKYFYSKGWFRANKTPLAEYSEEEARNLHENRELYCVLVDDNIRPSAFIEINNDFYGVSFLDDNLRPVLDYQFSMQKNGKLFLHMATSREYESGTDTVICGTTYVFKPSGEIHIIKEDFIKDERTESDTTSDVERNWESVPCFGEYDDLLKVER